MHLAEKGRGRALKRVWSDSDARRARLHGRRPVHRPQRAAARWSRRCVSGHSDLAIGTRLRARLAGRRAGPKREVISRGYNLLLRRTLRARFTDAQCGFKAIRRDVARELLPLVEDDAWFFDTELLVLAERAGLRIHEVPVDWVDDPDSRVDILRTAVDDLRGIVRLGRDLVAGRHPARRRRASGSAGPAPSAHGGRLGMQLVHVRGGRGLLDGGVRRCSTSAFRGLSARRRANLLALLLTAIGNTAANRRFTFGVRGPTDRRAAPGCRAWRSSPSASA